MANFVEVSGFPTPNFSGGDYNKFSKPQCTWYAYGRTREIAGVTLEFDRDFSLNAEDWWTHTTNTIQTSEPDQNCIAVWKDGDSGVGHVAFVYGVEGTEDYQDIFFSDSNWRGRSNLKAYRMSRDDFEAMNQGHGNFLGYLLLN